MIYVVSILNNRFVKIGFTMGETVDGRIASLQTASPFEITAVLTVNGTLRQEKSLHAALKAAFCRIRIPSPPNEWYHGRNDFMKEFIRRLAYGVDAALSYANEYSINVKQPGNKGRPMDSNIKWPVLTSSLEKDITEQVVNAASARG